MIFKENDIFKLKKKVEGLPLEKGMIGNVLMCFRTPREAYLVEFCDENGVTIAEIDLTEEFMEPVKI